jgi:hypothetical protein
MSRQTTTIRLATPIFWHPASTLVREVIDVVEKR